MPSITAWGGETVQSGPAYMWRTRTWKLILYFAEDLSQAVNHTDRVRGELYDLEHDPHEWRNLFADERHAGAQGGFDQGAAHAPGLRLGPLPAPRRESRPWRCERRYRAA